MGAGIAKQIRNKYPEVYEKYREYCKDKEPYALLGSVQAVSTKDGKTVANLFGQLNFGSDGKRYTSYDSFWNGLSHIKKVAKENGLSVALPYNMGCDRGGASWKVAFSMIEEIFSDYDLTIYKYKG
jgi:hypothetical protein